MPSWILSNIQFPQEAYKYGIAGIEQVCISASWDGKVFITSILNTLNPAFEKEIMDVISKSLDVDIMEVNLKIYINIC